MLHIFATPPWSWHENTINAINSRSKNIYINWLSIRPNALQWITTVCGLPVATLLAFSDNAFDIFVLHFIFNSEKLSAYSFFFSVSSVQHEINEGHKTKAVFQGSFKMRPPSEAGQTIGNRLGRPYSKGSKKKITFLINVFIFGDSCGIITRIYTNDHQPIFV